MVLASVQICVNLWENMHNGTSTIKTSQLGIAILIFAILVYVFGLHYL